MTAIPGDMTAVPPATTGQTTTMGRCPRCERWPWEQKCTGVAHA